MLNTDTLAVLSTSTCDAVKALAVAAPNDATCWVVRATTWSVDSAAICKSLNARNCAVDKTTRSSISKAST